MDLNLTISDLADGDVDRGRDDLGLSVTQSRDDGCLNDASSDDLTVTNVRDDSVLSTAGDRNDGNGFALLGPVTVVQVVEVTRETLVERRRFAQSQGAVLAKREAAGDEGTGLGRTVELELVVGCNISSPVLRIDDGSISQTNNEDAVLSAFGSLLYPLSVQQHPQRRLSRLRPLRLPITRMVHTHGYVPRCSHFSFPWPG